MKNLLFVSAQPDKPYFHWQVKLYVYNFIKNGIDPNQINVLFGIVEGNNEPSKEAIELKKLGINVYFYKDERDDKSYIPSIKPYLIWKWLTEYPEKGKLLFLHDSDIIFTKDFNVSNLLEDDITYLSDTIGYIGYNYIIECCDRYEKSHPSTEKNGLINEMSNIIGINSDIIKQNNDKSGGGQYIFKNVKADLWCKIYNDCTPLYNQMLDYDMRHPISNGQIQFWTAEMWSILWNLWLKGFNTKISNEISFCWATDHIDRIKEHPILHMAGVTNNLKTLMFYKGDYIEICPIEKLKETPNYFDYVDSNNASFFYISYMKEYLFK